MRGRNPEFVGVVLEDIVVVVESTFSRSKFAEINGFSCTNHRSAIGIDVLIALDLRAVIKIQ